MKKDKLIAYDIGKFNISTPKVVVSDPCYVKNAHGTATIKNTLTGDWLAFVVKESIAEIQYPRNRQLIAHSELYSLNKLFFSDDPYCKVWVDSGQAGIFSEDRFDGGGHTNGKGEWYNLCCDITLNTTHEAGVLEGGCVSSSGYGDGEYDLFLARNNKGEVVGVKLVFIEVDECLTM